MIDEILALPFADIPLVVLNATEGAVGAESHPGTRLRGLVANRKRWLHAAYKKWDRWRAGTTYDAFAPTDLESRLLGAALIRVQPRMTRFCDYFEDPDIERILPFDLDVAVRIGFRIVKGRALEIARFGVWSYHHGDNLRYRGGPAGFWEVAEGNAVTGSILQILNEELDAGRVIHRGFARTDPYSVARNRNNYYWKSAAVVARKLRELHELGTGLFDPSDSDAFDSAYSERLYTQPTNFEMIRTLSSMAVRGLRDGARRLTTVDKAILAYKFHPGSRRTCSAPLSTFYGFKTIEPPSARSWSQPFPVELDGKYYVFFTDSRVGESHGRISLLELDRRSGPGTARPVLERPYPLARPFVFQWKGEYYLIPSTPHRDAVELYRCTSFPDLWEYQGNLLEGRLATDPTLAALQGRWWMFVNLAQAEVTDCDDELHLFSAPTPLGPWTAHNRNPVKSDVRGARPAGQPFRLGAHLYRPAQDRTDLTTCAIVVHRILELDEHRYREEPVSSLLPRWLPGLVGMQTLNSSSGLTVVDAIRRRRSIG